MPPPRKITPELTETLLTLRSEGLSIRAIAVQLNYPFGTIGRWLRQYDEGYVQPAPQIKVSGALFEQMKHLRIGEGKTHAEIADILHTPLSTVYYTLRHRLPCIPPATTDKRFKVNRKPKTSPAAP